MKPLHILYVEDNDELRDTIAMLMESEGCVVTSCRSAEEALSIEAQHPVDAVVTDVSLPGRSGTELARELLARAPQRWVVLCSGYRFGQELARLGPNVRALLKPFDLDELCGILAEIGAAAQGGRAG